MTKSVLLELHRIGVIRFGQFEVKREFISPFHLDFSPILSHPEVAKGVCEALWEKMSHFSFDILCGGSIVGGCLASYLALVHDVTQVVRRADAPELAPKIFGSFKSGQKCLLLEDFFLTGTPSLDVIDDLEAEGLEVRDCVSLIDFGLGAKKKIKARGYTPHFVFSMREVINLLFEEGKIAGDAYKLSTDFLESVYER